MALTGGGLAMSAFTRMWVSRAPGRALTARRVGLATVATMENIERYKFYKWLDEADYDGPVGLTAKFTVDEGKVETFKDIMRENIAFTRRESGMLQYDLTPDFDRPNVFFLLERFESRAALLKHVQSQHYENCQNRFIGEMGEHPKVQICFYRHDAIEPLEEHTAAAEDTGHLMATGERTHLVNQGADGSSGIARETARAAVAQDSHKYCANEDMFGVSGKTVVVTGGAQGIGLAVAKAFAERGCGALFLLDVNEAEVEHSAAELQAKFPWCGPVVGIQCDVRKEDNVNAAAEAVRLAVAGDGFIGCACDVLVNCAGVTGRKRAEEFTMDEYDRIQNTNARGTWLTSMAFGALMRGGRETSSDGGCIINVDSFVTHAPLKHVVPYAMSKAGLQALTRGLAVEWGTGNRVGGGGVRVNGLAPGLIYTSISAAMWDKPHMAQWARQQTPLGRMGTVEDVVGTALFLASPAASFITGQTIRVDGGLSSGVYWPIEDEERQPAEEDGELEMVAAGNESVDGTTTGNFQYHVALPSAFSEEGESYRRLDQEGEEEQGDERLGTTIGAGGSSSSFFSPISAIAAQQPAGTFTPASVLNQQSSSLLHQLLDLPANPFEDGGLEANLSAGTIAPVNSVVKDGRQDSALVCPAGTSLNKRGVALLQHESQAIDNLRSGDAAVATEAGNLYDKEICALTKTITGADAVAVASRVLRNVGGAGGCQTGRNGEETSKGVRGGAFMAHGDFSDAFKEQLLEMYKQGNPSKLLIGGEDVGGMGITDEDTLRRGRLVTLNFWRALKEKGDPLRRAPLAVCDATTMRADDMRVYAHDPQPPPDNYSLPLPNLLTVPTSRKEHEWVYFPGMTKDEVIVIKTFDSKGLQPVNGVGVHSAFEDDAIDEDDLAKYARDSVETRVLCFFEENNKANVV